MKLYKSTYWFIAVLLLIIVIGLTSFFTLKNVKQNDKAVRHTYDVIEVLKQMQVNFTAAESAARAYLISANAVHLTTYNENAAATVSQVQKIRSLTSDNSNQQKNNVLLIDFVNRRLKDLEFKINHRNTNGIDSFILHGTKAGSELMLKAETVANNMQREELRLLTLRTSKAEVSRLIADTIIITGTLLNLAIVIYLINAIRRAFAKRKLAQVKLSESNKALDLLNKQKNYMLGMAAHDLRNPAAAITMMCDLWLPDVEEKLGKDDAVLLHNIQVSSNYMLKLLDDVLDVAKIESGKLSLNFSTVHIRDYIKRIWQLNSMPAHNKNIYIRLENTLHTDQAIAIDAVKIEQVINNLISNAIKFSNPGSEIILTAYTERDMLVVAVKDHGPGIPAAEQQKLFRAFERISVRSTGGEKSTGLGLAISADIIKQHNGTIEVNSEEGKGSVFVLRLPL